MLAHAIFTLIPPRAHMALLLLDTCSILYYIPTLVPECSACVLNPFIERGFLPIAMTRQLNQLLPSQNMMLIQFLQSKFSCQITSDIEPTSRKKNPTHALTPSSPQTPSNSSPRSAHSPPHSPTIPSHPHPSSVSTPPPTTPHSWHCSTTAIRNRPRFDAQHSPRLLVPCPVLAQG